MAWVKPKIIDFRTLDHLYFLPGRYIITENENYFFRHCTFKPGTTVCFPNSDFSIDFWECTFLPGCMIDLGKTCRRMYLQTCDFRSHSCVFVYSIFTVRSHESTPWTVVD